jgi:hypothetical protein
LSEGAGSGAGQGRVPPAQWAESAAITATLADGSLGFGIRIARFPGRLRAALWVHLLLPDIVYGYAEDGLPLTGFTGVTDVEARKVRFELVGEPYAVMQREAAPERGFRGAFRCAVGAHAAEHPPPGPGAIAVTIAGSFETAAPQRSRQGRMEAPGRVNAVMKTPAGQFAMESRAKWHEQTGERARFGAAFVYMSLEGAARSLLASRNAGRSWGFLAGDVASVPVVSFEIDPPGETRRFRAELGDGQVIEGVAKVLRAISVPIEGRRRPSSFVIAETNLGVLSGEINDWQPEE